MYFTLAASSEPPWKNPGGAEEGYYYDLIYGFEHLEILSKRPVPRRDFREIRGKVCSSWIVVRMQIN